jgi:hypothetical protein
MSEKGHFLFFSWEPLYRALVAGGAAVAGTERERGGAGALSPPPEPVAVTGLPGGAGCRRLRALALPAPDARLQLGLVQVLHTALQEAGQQVRDNGLRTTAGPRRREDGEGPASRSS